MIIRDSKTVEVGGERFYRYTVGDEVSIVEHKVLARNPLLVTTAKNVESNKFMQRYTPCNEIYFSEAFIKSGGVECSCKIKKGALFVGVPSAYSGVSGFLVSSSEFNQDLVYIGERFASVPKRCTKNALHRVMQPAVLGYADGKLIGWYICKSVNWLSIGYDSADQSKRGTYLGRAMRTRSVSGSIRYSLKDWFEDATVICK